MLNCEWFIFLIIMPFTENLYALENAAYKKKTSSVTKYPKDTSINNTE